MLIRFVSYANLQCNQIIRAYVPVEIQFAHKMRENGGMKTRIVTILKVVSD